MENVVDTASKILAAIMADDEVYIPGYKEDVILDRIVKILSGRE